MDFFRNQSHQPSAGPDRIKHDSKNPRDEWWMRDDQAVFGFASEALVPGKCNKLSLIFKD